MGLIYTLDIRNWMPDARSGEAAETTEFFTEGQAKEVFSLHQLACSEISEDISVLKERGLTEELEFRSKGLIYAFIEESGAIVGYGFGFLKNEQIFYIDQIYVSAMRREQGYAHSILYALLKHVQSNLRKVREVEAVTQQENILASKLLISMGFTSS